MRPVSVTEPGAITAGEATDAAALTVPTPGFHGVQNPTHAPWATGPKTPLIVMSALRNFAPNVAPPDATGMSGGGRQKTSWAEPIAVCAPLVGITYAGRLIVCPAACRTSRSVACGATVPTHAA